MSQTGTLRDLLPRFERYGAAPAIIGFAESGKTEMSFAELAEEARALAGGLLGAGIQRGETVALLAPNSPEWIVTGLAVMFAGSVVVPLDLQLGDRALAHELADSGCTRVFTVREALARLRSVAPSDRELEVHLLDSEEDTPEGKGWAGLRAAWPEDPPAVAPEDTAALFYTSGTTGLPKGVPLSHRNLLSNLDGLRHENLAHPGVRSLLPLPLHHVYPFMVGMLLPLDGGAAVVLPAGISGPELVRAMKQASATALIAVPRLYEALVSGIRHRMAAQGGVIAWLFSRTFDLSIWLRRRSSWRAGRLLLWPVRQAVAPHLRVVSCGGAALDEDLAWALEGLGWEVLTGYGLTETSPIVTFTGLGRGRIGTVGQPLPGVELRTKPVSDMPGGEIQVRGPNVFSGYRNRPEADREAFTQEGWFRTGDLGELDADGYLRVFARVAETIVLPDGKNVYPEEVEEVYEQGPLIREVAVLEHKGALVALVVPEAAAIRQAEGGDLVERVREEIRRRSRELPSYQRVTDQRVCFEALPRTSLGKLQRHRLSELFDAAARAATEAPAAGPALSPADRELLRAPVATKLLDMLGRHCPERSITLDADPQSDLGIDSLGWVSLTLEIEEELGVRLDESAIARARSVRDLIREVLAGGSRAFQTDAGAGVSMERERWLAPTGPMVRAAGAVFYAVNRLVLRAVFRLKVEGREHLPTEGPFLITPNHASFLDAFALAAALPRWLMEEAYWAGTTIYLFNSAPRRLFSRIAHVIPVDPEFSAVSGYLLGTEVLKRGKILIWFPEGRRSPDGRVQSFMGGIGRLTQDPDMRFVPVRIRGTFEAWPIGRRLPRPVPVSVRFGEAVTLRTLASKGKGRDEPARVVDALHARLAAMMEEGGAPGAGSSESAHE